MSSAVATPPTRLNRPNIVAVGTIVWLSSELMFFAALFAMYFTTRAVQGPEIWAESVELLNIPFSAINTTVLVLSSVTCQFGVFAAERFQMLELAHSGNFQSGECANGSPSLSLWVRSLSVDKFLNMPS